MEVIDVVPWAGCREPVSAVSHFAGALSFAVVLCLLAARCQHSRRHWWSVVLMGTTTISTLVISGCYHSQPAGAWRDWLLRADVSSIYILVAGSLTPVHALLFQGRSRWLAIALYWAGAILGVIQRLIYFDQMHRAVGIGILLFFGWGAGISAAMVWRKYGWRFVQNGVCAGLCYTVGATILLIHPPQLMRGWIGPHELWHASVLIGLALHWQFVAQFAIPKPFALRLAPATGPGLEPALAEWESDVSKDRRFAA